MQNSMRTISRWLQRLEKRFGLAVEDREVENAMSARLAAARLRLEAARPRCEFPPRPSHPGHLRSSFVAEAWTQRFQNTKLRLGTSSQAPIPSSTAASAAVASHPKSNATLKCGIQRALNCLSLHEQKSFRMSSTAWLMMTGRVQDDDRDAVPVTAIEAGGRLILQRDRPDGTRPCRVS
jgi:hypothetical protein